MEDDDSSRRKEYPVSAAKLSKTPSWIMLGFVLGVLSVLAIRRKNPPPPEPVRRVEFTAPSPARQPQPLTTVEDVFAVWGKHATWWNDTTEIALWNGQHKDFTDLFEVRRIDGVYYFRTIPALTRRWVIKSRTLPPECPLRFTETEEQYRERTQDPRESRASEIDLRPPPPAAPAKPGIPASPITPIDPKIDMIPDVKK